MFYNNWLWTLFCADCLGNWGIRVHPEECCCRTFGLSVCDCQGQGSTCQSTNDVSELFVKLLQFDLVHGASVALMLKFYIC